MGARTFDGVLLPTARFASVLSDRLLLRALCVGGGRFAVGSWKWL
jgi:hypothetical protein